jgi:ParB-like chromosome segregation protein Spo0J
VREIAAVIAELGFCDPILIGKDNVVLNGEARLEAAKLHAGSTASPAFK